ncbi:YihY/virulence factor BrkB family protein [Parvularcula dongshanensis]|uniref:Membrane protein n=1 Tax=Parvularcula dongshanensis TaxID=1173995 RepID=A0A840HZS5_9PROT|nr:YihY/virulence factor BrkB family protein [Parvularcula dongshanensis]MBB4657514.1 membrane protein [Parvularcula dongshanensis]
MAEPNEAARGRQASRPWDVPPLGWKDTLLRTKSEIKNDHVSLIAAGGAFFSLLALFPAVAAVVAIWGLIADPAEIVRQLDGFTSALPQEAADIIHSQARQAAEDGSGALLTAILAIALGIWSASKGMNAVIEGVNIAYDEEDDRGFIKKTLLRLVLTIGAIIGVVLAIGLVVVLPAVLKAVGLSGAVEFLIGVLKWAVLLAGAALAFAVLYRYAAARDEPRWAWVTPGAIVGVVLWLIGSIAFSVYVSNFASYNETYGTIGGAVILLMWLYLTCFVVLLGAEINAEVERQTKKDTTEGSRQPLGRRGAHAANTVGEARS